MKLMEEIMDSTDKWLHPNQFVSVVLTEVRQMIHVYAKYYNTI